MAIQAAIYVRVSTEEQGHKDLSIPFQLDTCRSYVAQAGWVTCEEYIDVASGKSDKREKFQSLILDARSKLFDRVIVYKYSRFARNDVDAVWYERELNKKGIDLVSATEPIDATTSTGWLNKRILQTFAEFENRQRAEFVKAAMKQKLLQGEWPWKAPLGYVNRKATENEKKVRTWVDPDPETAPLVVRLFEEAATGRQSMPELSDLAEEMGLLTRTGKQFTGQRMLDLLRNPFYKGQVESAGFDVQTKGVHEPLVDEDTWERVQLHLATRGKASYRTQRHRHLLRGMVKCACGLAMTAEFHDGGRNAYLRCMSSANKKYEGCGQMGPRLDAVIAEIEKEILPSMWVSDEDLTLVRDELRALLQKDRHVLVAEVHVLQTRIAHVKAKADALLDVRLDGEITKEEFLGKRASLDVELAKIVKRLEQVNTLVERGEDDLEEALQVANQLPELWAKAAEEDRRAILEAVFVRFVISKKKVVDVEVRPPYNWLVRWKPEVEATTELGLAMSPSLAAD